MKHLYNFIIIIFQDFGDDKPMGWSHFTAEGDVEFKALLFIPPKAPHDLYESYYNSNKSNLKLYVRRVFISDEFDDLLPKYLSFLRVLYCYFKSKYTINLKGIYYTKSYSDILSRVLLTQTHCR
jgi:hypothetical protein